MTDRVTIRKLPTGVQGLDRVLGGGLPEYSFNLIAGGPGCGKTTLAHQIMFANASEEKPAIYFTIFGEPPIKMLRYQQQFAFFDASKINRAIRFVHLGQEMLDGGLERVLERITEELESTDARIVIVDSFRSVARTSAHDRGDALGLEGFVQTLALRLTTHEATTFLVGEYLEQESHSNPVFTVCDGLVWLHQTVVRNSMVRRLQVMKVRGGDPAPGLHTLALSEAGMRVFPRLPRIESVQPPQTPRAREADKKTGVHGLDEMLGGGIPAGYSVLVAGPSGSGKTILATQFLLAANEREPAVIAYFDKRLPDHPSTGAPGRELGRLIREKKVELVDLRPLDLSVDEALEQIHEAVRRIGAKRVVIDSLSGFELALAPPFREDFREALYRMLGTLTSLGVTVLLTVELADSYTELRLSPQGTSFLTDGIILQRYVEMDGKLRKVMTVVKMRTRAHSQDLRHYEITEDGIVVGDTLESRRGVLTGDARPTARSARSAKRPAKKRGRA